MNRWSIGIQETPPPPFPSFASVLTWISLGRVRSDFEAFLTKWSASIGDGPKRERFLYNNYSLVKTVLSVRLKHPGQ